MYAAVTVSKLVPKVNPAALRRAHTSGPTPDIYPDGPH